MTTATGLVPVTLVEAGIAQVGAKTASGGTVAFESVHFRFTVPTNPPIGEIMTVELLFVVAPGMLTVTEVADTVKGAVTVIGNASSAVA
jgi:hypothetical protein